MLISMIAALAKNRVIGRDGRLPWHLPSDLRRFRELTMGHTLVMGRRTFESIGNVLDGRRTIVLSRGSTLPAAVEVAASVDDAVAMAVGADELFVCGGEEIYRLFFDRAERLFLTELDEDFSGDRYFPEFVHDFESIHCENVADRYPYRFSIFERRQHRSVPIKGVLCQDDY